MLIPPVLFLVFNRPEQTKQVFEEIRKAKPSYLYIAADGPRTHASQDQINCKEVRAIVETVDWECSVQYLFREQNLGCKRAVSAAITWFFEHEAQGVILEDDCFPGHSFFSFCHAMLEKYSTDTRVMHICGSNFQFGQQRGDGSYYFSRLPHVWGWATWRRAWQLYDYHMESYQKLIHQRIMASVYCDRKTQKRYEKTFSYIRDGTWDNWDQQWIYTLYINNGLSIIPNHNLISNIGFGATASAEYHKEDKVIMMPIEEITEIIHPTFMVPNREADGYTHNKVFNHPPLLKRLRKKLRKILSNP